MKPSQSFSPPLDSCYLLKFPFSLFSIPPLFPDNCFLWARSHSSSTSCQEVRIVAYVSSNMSVHEGKRGDGSKLLGKRKKKNSQRAARARTEFRFCVPAADTAEPAHKLMREGGKRPISTTNRLGIFLDVLFIPTNWYNNALVKISSLQVLRKIYFLNF